VLLVVALGYWHYSHNQVRQSDPSGVQTLAHPETAPAFTLVDQHLEPSTQARLLGKWTIMFFGYTHCPDFCPTTLAALNSAYHRFESDDPVVATSTQVVFVSMDPFRDSPPVLADYVNHFNSDFIGATGAPLQLHRLTEPLGVSYAYVYPLTGEPLGDTLQQPPRDYSVDHGSGIYIFNDRAQVVAWVLPPHTADRIVSVFKHIRSRYE
jgi:protein SCO1/2